MQELIYLSDAKLRQFVPEGRRRTRVGRRLTALRLNASTPVASGSVEFDLSNGDADPATMERLSEVIGTIENHALWYQDPAVRAGRWVYFEAPFNVASAIRPSSSGTVLFMDAPSADVGEREHPSAVRLLLHGSPAHLLRPVPETDEVVRSVFGSLVNMMLQEVARTPIPNAENVDLPHQARSHQDRYTDPGIRRLLLRSDRFPESAAWMRGYARVTIAASREADTAETISYVAATPLYVAYAHDLP